MTRAGIFIFAFSCLSFGAAAQTESLDSMAKRLDDLQTVRTARLNDISTDDRELAPKKKELDLWTSELSTGGIKKSEVALKQQKDAFNSEAARLKGAVDSFNASCVGRMPVAQYNACAQRKAGLQQWDARLHPKELALKNAIATHNKRFDQAMARRNALKAEVDKWEAAKAQHRQALADAETRIRALLASIQSRCKTESGTPEAVKYCNSVYWDNAARGLPPLAR